MPAGPDALAERADVRADAIPPDVLASTEPLVLRGLVAHWPAVQAGQGGPLASIDHMRRHYRDATVGAWFGPPGIQGRFFYDDTLTGFNFSAQRVRLDGVLDALARHRDDARAPAIYVGSTTVDTCLPGFRDENDVPLPGLEPLASIWIGNRTRVAAHQDLPDNLACVVAGRRRFTLFPPDEVANLYVGPLDLTPAGQPISLVDVVKPDLARFPRFAEAMARARVAELQAGDAIFIPSMWWHHVEALDSVNVLLNYWWRRSPAHMDSPVHALQMAMASVRDLPPAQRQAWRHLFEHYVFDADDDTAAHIPPAARGSLAPLTPDAARQWRARLLRSLNR
ncbi:MAG: cupin-like domain-containing protein [Rhodoferax sp.]|nr:cupin-like domain-containing protein [Rhodoferax sp.]